MGISFEMLFLSEFLKPHSYEKKLLMRHGCPKLKLLNDFLISVQLLIKELIIKKKSCIETNGF